MNRTIKTNKFLTCIALDIRCVDFVIGDMDFLKFDCWLQFKLLSLVGVSSKSSSSSDNSLLGVSQGALDNDFRLNWMEDDFRSFPQKLRSINDGHFKFTMLTPFISLLVMNRPLLHNGVVVLPAVCSENILLKSGSDLWNDLKSFVDLLLMHSSTSTSSFSTLNATVFRLLALQADVFCSRFMVSLSNSKESTSSSLRLSTSSFFGKDSVATFWALQTGVVQIWFAFNDGVLFESTGDGEANVFLSDCSCRGM